MNQIEYSSNTRFEFFYESDVRDAVLYKKSGSVSWLLSRGRKTEVDYLGGTYGKTCTFIPCTMQEAFDHIYHTNPKIIKPKALTINAGDKIFFANSTFPSLLLGRLDVDLKRTTKPDNADKIVSDCDMSENDIFHNVVLIDPNKFVLTRLSWQGKGETINTFSSVVTKTIDLFNQMGYNVSLYVCISKQGYEVYQALQTHSAKLISTTDFTKYIVSQLPQMQPDEVNNIAYMLKSQDQATVSTALGTLQYYNFAEHMPQILEALMTTQCYDLPNNREATYLYSLFGLDRGSLYAVRNCGVKRQIQFFMDCLNKFVVTPSMSVKQKVYTSLRALLYDKIANDYKDELSRLDVSLSLTPNDENRTTNSSAETVEGA